MSQKPQDEFVVPAKFYLINKAATLQEAMRLAGRKGCTAAVATRFLRGVTRRDSLVVDGSKAAKMVRMLRHRSFPCRPAQRRS